MKPTDFQSKMWCFITVVKPSRQRVSMQFGAIIPPLFCSSRNLPLSRIAHSLFLSTVSRSVWIFRAAWPIANKIRPHSRGWWQACLYSGNAEFILGIHIFPYIVIPCSQYRIRGGLSAGCGRVCNADKGLCRAQSLRGVRMDAVRGIEGKGNRNLLS